MVARYQAGSGRDLRELPWYVAFGYFKLAVDRRGHPLPAISQGKTVGEGFDHFGARVPLLLNAALEALDAS